MQCVFCNRKPNEIPEYVQQAQVEEMSAHEYVRMDEGTYHVQTDLFCCTRCYTKHGMPLNTKLIALFELHRAANVVPFERG